MGRSDGCRRPRSAHGVKLIATVENGKRLITPMLIVIVALGTTDLLFALDSIPAIYGLTKEPYLVFTANVFALMGLRQLYFLIGGLLQRLVYLSLGLSVVLGLHRRQARAGGAARERAAVHQRRRARRAYPRSRSGSRLVVILGTLVVTTVASLLKVAPRPVRREGRPTRRRRRRPAPPTGTVAAEPRYGFSTVKVEPTRRLEADRVDLSVGRGRRAA